ncbi:MAG: hypothetical protein KDC98_05700 [Planctomycetes bacterium]|nr:hypothetical protein [Planctomycetota bacterium]
MSHEPKILGVGVVDELGIDGTAGVHVTWRELETEPPGTPRTRRAVFGASDDTYRRLDRQCRTLVLAAEATGLDGLLLPELRQRTALITETAVGSIEVDLRYTRSLAKDLVEAAAFPYTLPSTCLGEVALRHGLRGPTNCLSVEADQRGESLREARRLLLDGEIAHAVVGVVDVLGEEVPTLSSGLRAVVCVLAAHDAHGQAVVDWPAERPDPFAALIRCCR